jgi:hypothetical protein
MTDHYVLQHTSRIRDLWSLRTAGTKYSATYSMDACWDRAELRCSGSGNTLTQTRKNKAKARQKQRTGKCEAAATCTYSPHNNDTTFCDGQATGHRKRVGRMKPHKDT